jgi:sulfur-carrier protein
MENPMALTVRIPTPLRPLTGGEEAVAVEGVTLRDVIDHLENKHPGMKERLLDEKGVRRFVNIYIGDEDVRFLDGLDTKLSGNEEISIVPAIAGG